MCYTLNALGIILENGTDINRPQKRCLAKFQVESSVNFIMTLGRVGLAWTHIGTLFTLSDFVRKSNHLGNRFTGAQSLYCARAFSRPPSAQRWYRTMTFPDQGPKISLNL